MKVILSVPDEGYCERTWWRLLWASLMKVIVSVPDEGYCERTWYFSEHMILMDLTLTGNIQLIGEAPRKINKDLQH
jgi:hypothetical protein